MGADLATSVALSSCRAQATTGVKITRYEVRPLLLRHGQACPGHDVLETTVPPARYVQRPMGRCVSVMPPGSASPLRAPAPSPAATGNPSPASPAHRPASWPGAASGSAALSRADPGPAPPP